MDDYLLPNYQLSCFELLQSLIVSEYGLRHLEQARINEGCRWGHRMVALVQFVPVLGQLVMLVEWVVSRLLDRKKMNELLFEGSQNGCNGIAERERVLQVVDRVDRLREQGVFFNRSKITGSVEGGVCSAMSMDFAGAFFKLRKVNVNVGQSSSDFFLKSILDLGAQFAQSSEEMRIRQAAFNTIEVRRDAPSVDVSRSKVQSLANFYGFKINHASDEIVVNSVISNRILDEEVSKLPDGLYLLRTIQPSNNERLERCGHSMIYFKERQEGLLYDPNVGARYMRNVNHTSELSQSLSDCYQAFSTSRARFYRLCEA